MKISPCFILALLSTLAVAPLAVAAKPTKKEAIATQAAATQFDGTITAISDKAVIVKGATGEKTFAIHPGTVFGQRAAKKLADFKAGDHVLVVFSNAGGQLKAENVRNPDDDKKPGKKKAAAAK